MSLHALFLLIAPCLPAVPAEAERVRLVTPQRYERFVVVSDHQLASDVGAKVLEEGGNAVDAAVAAALALAVVHPAAGNLGGGGFLVVRLPDGKATCFDFREKAPQATTAALFLDKEGRYDPDRHHEGALSVGVPGTVAGLHQAHESLGKLSWRRLARPAVDLAARGFPVSPGLAEDLRETLPRMKPYPATLAKFTKEGQPLRAGGLLVQPDLARTLERIRDRGAEGFYSGETAELIVKEIGRLGGIITLRDLAEYRAVERKPLQGTYRGFEVISMPPPSSGGVALLEMLNVLEGYDLASLGVRGSRGSHLMIEAMRRAFADRARHLGDPDSVEMPLDRLLSKDYAAALREGIRPLRASRSSMDSFEWPAEGTETTHISVVDGDLMAVALTTTLEQAYGSCIVVPGAGFLLNNEMGDFNPREGLTTEGGLIGTPPNLPAPGKRMLSSMTPTIVVEGGLPRLVIGSPGGRTIINTVLEVLVAVVDHRLLLQEAIDQPRFHHQWLPDRVVAEPRCFSPDTITALEAMGHTVEVRSSSQGSAMGIAVLPRQPREITEKSGKFWLEAGVDRRRPDGGAAGQ